MLLKTYLPVFSEELIYLRFNLLQIYVVGKCLKNVSIEIQHYQRTNKSIKKRSYSQNSDVSEANFQTLLFILNY